MKLLVISREPNPHAKAVQVIVGDRFEVLGFGNVEEAGSTCSPVAAGGVLFFSSKSDSRVVRDVASARRMGYNPVVVCRDSPDPDWDERVILAGASHILESPPRAKLVLAAFSPEISRMRVVPTNNGTDEARGREEHPPAPPVAGLLGPLREFSRLLREVTHEDSLIKAYMERLNDTLKLNRMVLYVRGSGAEATRLKCSFATGIEPEVYRQIALSLDRGLGQWMRDHMIALSITGSSRFSGTGEAIDEMRRLRAQVALPFQDGERLIGLCLVGSKYNGHSLSDAEIEDVILLLGELGRAISHARLVKEVDEERRFLGDLCDQMGAGLLVIDARQQVRHVNFRALEMLGGGPRQDFSFKSIPPGIGSMVFRAQHEVVPEANYHGADGRLYRLSASRLAGAPNGEVLLLAKDISTIHSQHERDMALREQALLSRMGEQFVHEVRNGLARLSGLGQLMPEKRSDPEFLDELQAALPLDLGRILREAELMFCLTSPAESDFRCISLADTAAKAWAEACRMEGAASSALDGTAALDGVMVSGSETGISRALKEIFLNALQSPAAPGGDRPAVLLTGEEAAGFFNLAIHDNGPGFSDDVATTAMEPFTTTKNRGFGLGLTVARRILSDCGGGIEVGRRSDRLSGAVVQVRLPLFAAGE